MVVGDLAQGLSWPEIEETEPTLEGNARLKAATVSELTGLPGREMTPVSRWLRWVVRPGCSPPATPVPGPATPPTGRLFWRHSMV